MRVLLLRNNKQKQNRTKTKIKIKFNKKGKAKAKNKMNKNSKITMQNRIKTKPSHNKITMQAMSMNSMKAKTMNKLQKQQIFN